MCGISGIFNWHQQDEFLLESMKRMVASLKHRGPDGHGIYIDDHITLGHSRLSIIDPQGGQQPLPNEDESLWLTCNGEIFNYIELREELEAAGHRFSTDTDVEVLLHLYEDHKENLFNYINGQFAFAIWDRREHKMLLGRDHVGICPLYYWYKNKQFAFASEIKALFQIPQIEPSLNLTSLIQTFTFWSPLPGYTPFQNIFEIKPGCFLWVTADKLSEHRYWSPPYKFEKHDLIHDVNEASEQLSALLEDAVRLRLRADVPVGAYLSGGLDSSIITSLIKTKNNNYLRTFSIGFQDKNYDETGYQQLMSQHLHTDHSAYLCTNQNIFEVLTDVVWHAEKPLLRTAPAPLFLLSKLVNDSGYKVVLTGEGADEFFSGYNIFKETKVRCFNARYPQSKFRPLLFKRLYPYLDSKNDRAGAFWYQFFKNDLQNTGDPFYSHRIRWRNSSFILQFLNKEILARISEYDPLHELFLELSNELEDLPPLSRAHLLEVYIFLGSYLLSSQGDRMLMSHAVEGRYPFLDKRVIEFANRLSPVLKLKGLKEKWILKQTFAEHLPQQIIQRDKQPYRAPIKSASHLFAEMITNNNGIFSPQRVDSLKKKIVNSPNRVSAREEMAWTAIITTEILIDLFIYQHGKEKITPIDGQWVILDRRTSNGKGNKE